jgi:hypothetical protein
VVSTRLVSRDCKVMFIIMCCRVATALAIALMAVGWVIVQDFRRTFMLPKRRCGKAEQKINADARHDFQGREYSIWTTKPWKMRRKSAFHFCSAFPNLRLGWVTLLCATASKHALGRAVSCVLYNTVYNTVWRTKNCAISHPLPNEETCIREYSTIRPIKHISFKSFSVHCNLVWLLSTHAWKFLR